MQEAHSIINTAFDSRCIQTDQENTVIIYPIKSAAALLLLKAAMHRVCPQSTLVLHGDNEIVIRFPSEYKTPPLHRINYELKAIACGLEKNITLFGTDRYKITRNNDSAPLNIINLLTLIEKEHSARMTISGSNVPSPTDTFDIQEYFRAPDEKPFLDENGRSSTEFDAETLPLYLHQHQESLTPTEAEGLFDYAILNKPAAKEVFSALDILIERNRRPS